MRQQGYNKNNRHPTNINKYFILPLFAILWIFRPLDATAAADAAASTSGPVSPNAQPSRDAQPVGQKPDSAERPPDVAPLFEQPGILTPHGTFVVEPSLQYAYSSSNRVALVGYTVIPAITIGLINVQEVKSNTLTGTASIRYGLTNRWEVEARLPVVARYDDIVALPLNTGSSTSTPVVNSERGQNIGDVEAIVRYQINNGGADNPYYVASLRFKSRTGKDPFQIETQQNITGFNGIPLQSQLPTGSGFYGIQPGVSVLFPSDPVVFFGGLSYLHNFSRDNVTENTDGGPILLGKVTAGDIITLNFGMGLSINTRASFSLGYEQDSIDKTLVNDAPIAGSTRVELGTLLVGMSYRRSRRSTISASVGAGVTRDTPDVTLTLRVPMIY